MRFTSFFGMDFIKKHDWMPGLKSKPHRFMIATEDGGTEELLLSKNVNKTQRCVKMLQTESYTLMDLYRKEAFDDLLQSECDHEGKN